MKKRSHAETLVPEFRPDLSTRLTCKRLGGRRGSDPTPHRFFLNSVRSIDPSIDAKVGIPLCKLILRPRTKLWTIFSIFFLVIPNLVTRCQAIFCRKLMIESKIGRKKFEKSPKWRYKENVNKNHQKSGIKVL